MTDKKLSDSEIIKALECCSVEGHFVCNECPAWVESRCIAKNKYILDLINRSQAKFIKEQNKNSKLRNERNRLQAENKRLEKAVEDKGGLILIKQAKAEAYKEFAYKVENEIDCQPHSKGLQESAERYRIKRIINNLLKEKEVRV